MMKATFHRKIDCLTLLAWFLCMQPLLVLVIKGWSSTILILGGLACLITIAISKKKLVDFVQPTPRGWELNAFLFTNSLPFLLIGMAGLLRNDLHAAQLDSPTRFLLAVPVFLLVRHLRTNIVHVLTIFVALGLLSTLAHQVFFPSPRLWDEMRMSNHFADPLAFGYISLSFALISLTSLGFSQTKELWLVILKIFAFGTGIYMSVMTQSRTGWLAAPLVLAFLLYLKREQLSLRAISISLLFALSGSIATYTISEKIHSRVDYMINELVDYSFQGVAPDTSVGLRITFLRIAFDLIVDQPVLGHGDTQIKQPVIPNVVKSYASPYAIDFALSSGFHNEVITNAVQHGLPVALATFLIFAIPFAIYCRGLRKPISSNNYAAAIGIVFTLTYFISSLSTEVFGLKYTGSLYALVTALLCAATTRDTPEISRS